MSVAFNPQIMTAVEQLDYVVTVGDVASRAGLEINQTQQALLTLASEAGAHLQVANSGEMVFEFPRQFRTILRNKFWRLRLQAWAKTLWQGIFYLIRISFGILLVLSILLMLVAIAAIVIAINSKSDSDNDNSFSFGGDRQGGGGGFFFFPTDIFWLFSPNPYDQPRAKARSKEKGLNFLEAIFSFLFGDGDPNRDLEEKRWQTVGTLIRNNGGAIAAEQVAPYLDNVTPLNQENEDYIIPVLARFNGYPQVSPNGEIIYTFPDLQVSAQHRAQQSLASYLREKTWKFSQASSGQIIGAIALGGVNLVLALTLGSLLMTYDIDLGLIQFVQGIYGVLVAYAVGFLSIPLGRYFWLQRRNQGLEKRNEKRQERAKLLQPPTPTIKAKLDFAQEWTESKVISAEDVTYRTDQDLHEQEALRSDQIDEEWRRRLESGL
jgi:hypothetical protein